MESQMGLRDIPWKYREQCAEDNISDDTRRLLMESLIGKERTFFRLLQC